MYNKDMLESVCVCGRALKERLCESTKKKKPNLEIEPSSEGDTFYPSYKD